MPAPTLADLNRDFGNPAVKFLCGPGGLPVASLATPAGAALVCLQGAHVLAWRPADAHPVIWLSGKSWFEDGKPIRGGIPLCWPWFGVHATDPTKPGHGFARLRRWTVAKTSAAGGKARLVLTLSDDEATRALWPHGFKLTATITVGRTLELALAMANPGDAPYTCSAALHSYFAVGDVRVAQVLGLAGRRYLDTVPGVPPGPHLQHGAVTISAETDRVYLDTTDACRIVDPVLGRAIRIAKRGSHSSVVWNPWIEKAKRMPDFGDDEYPGMLCVETCNAREDAVTVAPGSKHVLAATIGIASLRRRR